MGVIMAPVAGSCCRPPCIAFVPIFMGSFLFVVNAKGMHLRTYFWTVSGFFRCPITCFTLTFVVAFVSCQTQQQPTSEEDIKELEYSQVETVEQFGESCSEPGASCMELKLTYPEINTKEDSIASILKDSVDQMLLSPILGEERFANEEEMKASIDKAYRQYREDFPEVETKWFVDRNVKVVGQWQGVVCISYYESSYLGGAHPNTMTFYKNYSLNSGKRVFLEAWFNSSQRELIRQYAERTFREENGLTANSSLAEAGYWFADDKFSLTDNYMISEEGLTFLYNPYEIAPYSYGAKEVFVPARVYNSI